MNDILFELKELAFVIAAKNHNPTILNPDFLKFNSIVPEDFILAGAPVCVEPFARVEYQNKISITAEPEKVTFRQPFLNADDVEKSILHLIAAKYVETLPHVTYSAIGINPNGHLVLDKEDDADAYVLNKFVKDGPWISLDNKRIQAGLDFSYDLDSKSKFAVKIKPTFFNSPEGKKVRVVLFASNFHHDVSGQNTKERNENQIGRAHV
jgi:hypothetical protein